MWCVCGVCVVVVVVVVVDPAVAARSTGNRGTGNVKARKCEKRKKLNQTRPIHVAIRYLVCTVRGTGPRTAPAGVNQGISVPGRRNGRL